jgi:hypothetical protein
VGRKFTITQLASMALPQSSLRNRPRRSAKQSDVLAVTKDELHHANTSTTPTFLGLTDPGGLWAQLGGPTGTRRVLEPEKTLLSAWSTRASGRRARVSPTGKRTGQLLYQSLAGRHGRCEDSSTDGSWSSANCNKKLIWARHFNAAWGGDAAIAGADGRGSFYHRGTTTAMARTRRQPPAGKTGSNPRGLLRAFLRSAGWLRELA